MSKPSIPELTRKEWITKLAAAMYQLRKDRGFTQMGIAKLMGMSQAWVCKVEQGILEPSFSDWMNFCRITEIPIEYVFEVGSDKSKLIELRDAKRRLEKEKAAYRKLRLALRRGRRPSLS